MGQSRGGGAVEARGWYQRPVSGRDRRRAGSDVGGAKVVAPAAILRPRLSVSSACTLPSASAATPGKIRSVQRPGCSRAVWASGCIGDSAGPGRADSESRGEARRWERGDGFPGPSTQPSRGRRPRAWALERGLCAEALRLDPNSFSFTELPKMCNPGRSGCRILRVAAGFSRACHKTHRFVFHFHTLPALTPDPQRVK